MPLLVPLEGEAVNSHQEFSIQLGDNLFQFRLDWKYTTNRWSVNITIGETLTIAGAIIQPNCDILQVWNMTSTLGKLVCVSLDGSNPTLDNLGTNIKLLWYSPDE
jgi:hypothetical protein